MTDANPDPGPTSPGFWRTDRISGAVLLGLAVAIAWETRVLPLGTFGHPGPGAMPMALAFLLGLCATMVIVGGGDAPPLRAIRWQEGGHAAGILGSAAFAALALETLGYRLTILAILVFLLGVMERRSPVAVALASFGISFGTYFVFADLLKVVLPTGPWGL
ncbi:MAG: tripartite tricarboxylate transporter TctB family protein [Rhodospirillales bacterium]|nr:tripartite tricarboxylate transporter TctB family protein [Rhodospirillales bacterium]